METFALMRSAVAIAVVGAVAASSALSPRAAQAPAPGPARDSAQAARPAAAPATASIAGRVMLDGSASTPVARVVVIVTGPALPMRIRSAMTDDEGRFVIDALSPGRYTLYGRKAGYVNSYYGARRPWRPPGTPISLTDGQQLANVVLPILAGAVVSGRAFDQNGEPLQGVSVTAYERTKINGQDTVIRLNSQPTDDRGEYRIYGLPPTEVLMGAQPPSAMAIGATVRLVTDADVRWATNATQQGRGAAPAAAPPPSGAPVAYTTVYYPGVTDNAMATAIPLTAGAERAGIDVQLQFVPTARVAGTITDENGRPAAAGTAITIIKFSARGEFSQVSRSTLDPQGRFTITGLSPGTYVLDARGFSKPPAPQAPTPAIAAAARLTTAPTPDLWARGEVSVNGNDITGLSLVLQPGLTVSGRVVLEGRTLQAPTDLSGVSIRLIPPPSSATAVTSTGSATVNPDGTFTIPGVVPGRYVVATTYAAGGTAPSGVARWMAQSATVNGVDAIDTPIEIHAGEVPSNIAVKFIDYAASVKGRIIDGAGRPAPDFTLVLFSTDNRFWQQNSRRTRTMRPGQDGSFEIANLPAGTYHLAALADMEGVNLGDAALLEQLIPASVRVTLVDGESKTQDVQLAGR